MSEVLKAWLRKRLGILIELTPELFGHYTKDGHLLALVLHSYGIINHDQLSTIIQTSDPALCRVNLKHLHLWLRFIGVDCTDDCIEEISHGKGATSLQLFYKVYLSLEDKDSLYFITLQKEREKYIPSSIKFDVITVPEESPQCEPLEHYLSKPLKKSVNTIKWHRNKFQNILESCRKDIKQFKTKLETKERSTTMTKIDLIEPQHPLIRLTCETKDEDHFKEMNEFAQKHRIKSSKRDIYEPCTTDKLYDEVLMSAEHPVAAKSYISWLKNRKKKENIDNAVKSRLQSTLMSEFWQKLSNKEDNSFDELLARRVLDQSHYEKQMVTKLAKIRSQKNVITENRKIVDQLTLDAKENKARLDQERIREEHDWEYEDVNIEYRRLCELHRRIRKEKLIKLRDKHKRMCREVINDLIDIAIKVFEYQSSSNEGSVPKVIWNEWKKLFLKCQPIFDLHENEFVEKEKEEKIEEIVQSRLNREEVLNEANFESYHTLQSPWDEYIPSTIDPEIEEILKLGELVLGYIVHRLLEFVYPYPLDSLKTPIPKVKTSAIVLGIVEPSLYNSIRTLLKKSGICLITMEDAINYCLLKYKEEMSDVKYIDVNVVKATEDIFIKRKNNNSSKNIITTSRSRKTQRSNGKISLRRKNNKEREKDKDKGFEEKETQTPRLIPYDDMSPILSDAAYIGKWTYEFLTLGQPISNDLNTKIIVEYIKSLGEIEGWALIDYPNNYDQMARLEFALTGHKIPSDNSNLVDFDNVNIEEIDPISPRIVYEDTEIDDYAIYRQSKLLPNPITKKNDYTSTSTFVTTYVRAIHKPTDFELDPNNLFEVLPEDATPIDKFYTEENVAYVVYYNYFDIDTIKRIVRLVIGDKSIPRTPSIELFGKNALKSLENIKDLNKTKIFTKKIPSSGTVRQLVTLKKSITILSNDFEEEKEEEEETKNIETGLDDYVEDVSRIPKPGESGWEWLDFYINPVLLDALATLWENIEEIYILDLMNIFSLKRTHYSSIIPYKDFVMRNMKEFIDRPDNKENLLQEFQNMFNKLVDDDMRKDEEIKCELYCRLNKFQINLWDICDTKRIESEIERKRIVNENWTNVEAFMLINIYLSIIQIEIDRCVDTLQIIQDYYISMLQRPIKEIRLRKILLDRISIREIDKSSYTIEDKKDRRTILDKIDQDKPIIDPNDLTLEIKNLFIDVINSIDFVSTDSLIYKAILDNVNYVKKYVEFINAIVVNDLTKIEDNVLTGRDRIWKKSEFLTSDNINEKLINRGHELFQEWKYAVLFEINRMRIRLDVILASAEADVNYLLDTMRFAFHRIYDNIIDRYEKEKKSIDEMTKIFCLAIEEEKSIQEELVLEGDNFYIRSHILTYPEKPLTPIKLIKETIKSFSFTISQLGRLMNIFRIISPSGKLTERSFIYILQDMISYNMDIEDDGFGSMPIPKCWRLLKSCDLTKLVEMIFGNCEYIEWREFLIYAINLPIPSQDDILNARDRFKTLDKDKKEIVTIDQYRSIPLWFLEYTDDISSEIKYILFDDFQKPYDQILPEEIDLINPDKLMSTMISDKLIDYVRYLRIFNKNDDKILNQEDIDDNDEMMIRKDAENALRLVLAKELLSQMYLIDRYSINYTALLLAFCKDDNPREGLAKAISLAIGNKICTDFDEGEKYVKKIIEDKLLLAKLEAMRNLLREEAIQVTNEIINDLLEKTIAGVIIEEVDEYKIPRRLMIQKLDGSEEIDPSILLQVPSNYEQISDDEQSVITIPESCYEFDERIRRKLIYWIPYDICLAVLLATLPFHASQSDLFQTTKTLHELLRDVYDELYDEDLSDNKNTILSHRFLNHRFVNELLNSTSKFSVKHLDDLLSEIITAKDKERII